MKLNEYLSANLPYELKVYYEGDKSVYELHGIIDDQIYIDYNGIGTLMEGKEEIMIVPIVRSLSDLPKPITQKGYNNGEPFGPIVELAKMALNNPTSKWIIIDEMAVDDNNNCFLFNKETFDFELVSYNLGMVGPIANQLKLFQLLLFWHFNLLDEGIEKVLVTDEFNPY